MKLEIGAHPEKFKNFPEQALEQEKGALEKFRGRAKAIAGVLMLVSTLSSLPETIKAEQTTSKKEGAPPQAEKETNQEKDINFINNLSKLPETHGTEKTARVLIQFYAQQREGVAPGHLSIEKMRSVLGELVKALSLFVDRTYGNNDGQPDPEEMTKENELIRENAAIRALMEVFAQFAEEGEK